MKLKDIAKKSHNFYKSKNSMIFFTLTISVFSLIQIILFSLGVMRVNGTYVSDGSITIWIAFIFSILSSITGFVGGVYSNRKDSKFMVWIIVSDLSFAINAFLTRAIMIFISTLIMSLLVLLRKFLWDYFEKNDKTFNNKKVITYILLSFFFVLSISYLCILLEGDWLYGEHIKIPWVRYFDATQAVLVLFGSIFLIFKMRLAFIFFLFSNMFSIAFFLSPEINQIIPLVQIILFSLMDITALLSWTHKED